MKQVVSINDCEFTWVIPQLDCIPSTEGSPDYVLNVHYRYQASYQNTIVDTYGVISFGEYKGEEFIPFEELTKENVISWLEFLLNTQELKEKLVRLINDVINPPIISLQLPWDNTPSEGSIINT